MNQMTTIPGCGPSGGLLDCYDNVASATAFIVQVLNNAIQTNPDTQKYILELIQTSGMPVPLVGVTNGQPAQPGQVGEFVRFAKGVSILQTAQTQSITMGVLQPGDWDCWIAASPSGWTADIQLYINPLPAGFIDQGYVILGDQGPVPISASGPAVQGLISVPSLITVTLTTNNSGPGEGPSTCGVFFWARRRR